METSALDFSQCNFFVVVKVSFTDAGTGQTSTCQAEIILHHTVQRLSVECLPPFFWLEDLSVFGTTKLQNGLPKVVSLLFNSLKGVNLQWSPAFLLILLPVPPPRHQIQQRRYTVSLPLKSLPNCED